MEFHFLVDTPQRAFEVTPQVLDEFKQQILIDTTISDRYSRAFLADLYCHERIFGIHPEEVLDAIKEETGINTQGCKKATKFRNRPLKGLWHKHYYSGRFIGHNLYNEMANGKLEKIVSDVFEPHMGKPATKDMFEDLAKRAVHDSLDERRTKSKTTGEWVTFAKHNNQNYYLCMATHDNGDDAIRNKIDLICRKEFQFLDGILQ